jgi:CRISPR system Cascade subunit CasC
MSSRFVQIHTLTHYPASLLNRDDAGFAKRMPFGGAVRTRISSQCLKRHWRTHDGENSLRAIEVEEFKSIRSRVTFERLIVDPLVKQDVPRSIARIATQQIVDKVFGSEAKQAKKEGRGKERKAKGTQAKEATPESHDGPVGHAVETEQVTVVGMPELEYLRALATEAIKSAGGASDKVAMFIDGQFKDRTFVENLKALRLGAGLSAALFGRMVTGDILARTDAAIHVAHATTVHAQMTESDYFTAIDDLVRDEGEQGSGHINASELTSGLFYGYVVVDVNGLVANLGGDRMLASQVTERLVHIISTVSPGAKRGSTAPYAYSHLVIVESGNAQPRTLQNAFIEPVRTSGDLVQNAYSALRRQIAELDSVYGKGEERAHAGLFTTEVSGGIQGEIFENRKTLADLAQWTGGQVRA